MQVAAGILILGQWILRSGRYDNSPRLGVLLTTAGVTLVIISFLRMLYLFVKQKDIASPVLGSNAAQSSMRPIFKALLVVVILFFAIALSWMLFLLLTSY